MGEQAPTILIVDDNPVNRRMAAESLKGEGAELVFAQDGREALVMLSDVAVDLVLMDIVMPDMGGLETVRRMKTDPVLARIPVIFLTGWDEKGMVVQGFEAGCADYVTKPFHPREMRARVRAQLKVVAATHRLETTVAQRTRELEASRGKLERLIRNGIALSAERDDNRLFEMILTSAKELTGADGGTLYILSAEGTALDFAYVLNDTLGLEFGGTSGRRINFPPLHLRDPATGAPNHKNVASHAALNGRTVLVADAYASDRFDFSGVKAFDGRSGYTSRSFLAVPLMSRKGTLMGVIQLINALDRDGAVVAFDPGFVGLVEALAAQAAIALDNKRLLGAQRELMDSFIQLIASAIDTKSPYTGAHCERVPEIAKTLVVEACAADHGSFRDFNFSTEEEWREFHVGAWLHDWGKVTTPEYVIDKATKLETIYNRIHEVRTRFEVLWRDAEIAYWRGRAEGGDPATLAETLEAEQARLQEEFAVVARANVGGEFLDEASAERIRAIAGRSWTRHFDDRLGLGHLELRHAGKFPANPPPAEEPLLADRPEHVIPRGPNDHIDMDRHGFTMTVPEHLYNRGELYNLLIGKGTLTREERFKINEHVMQTIVMLEALPFPEHLKRVPEYAGTHHETTIGTGYPRGLTNDQLSIPARVMVVADIFEALTSPDRPYKSAKTLSQALRIMGFMRDDKHIDAEVFDLFLCSGAYRRCAEVYLPPEQLDSVDITELLSPDAPCLR